MNAVLHRCARATRERLKQWHTSETAVSAVEFAFFAPFLCLSLVAMADIATAVTERLAMNHILRTGAQQAMADLGTNNVLATIQIAAATENFSLCSGDANPDGKFCPEIDLDCYCPNKVPTSCTGSTICPATVRKTYTIVLTKKRKSMILKDFNFEAKTEVHVR